MLETTSQITRILSDSKMRLLPDLPQVLAKMAKCRTTPLIITTTSRLRSGKSRKQPRQSKLDRRGKLWRGSDTKRSCAKNRNKTCRSWLAWKCKQSNETKK